MPAFRTNAAEHGDEDGDQDVGAAVIPLDRGIARGDDDAGDGRQQTGQRVGDEQQAPFVDAAIARRLGIAAEQQQLDPEAGVEQHETDGGSNRKEEREAERHAQHRQIAEVVERLDIAEADGRAVGEIDGEPGEEQLRPERGDQGRQPRIGDDHPVEQATGQADDQGKGGKGPGEEDRRFVDRHHRAGKAEGDDAGEIGKRDAGKVDPAIAGDHCQHDTERQEAQFRHL